MHKAIISVIGEHGSETVEQIVARKREDIAKCGFALWMNCSLKSIPCLAQNFLAGEEVAECLFVASSGESKRKPHGNARPTRGSSIDRAFSANRLDWIPMHDGMSPVGEYLSSACAHALVIDRLDYAIVKSVDLRYWAEPDGSSPLMLSQCHEIMLP